MQEAQRVGRVQRIAPGKHAAWFFSLLSEGTKEEEYGQHRREFMEQHGYRYEFIDAAPLITGKKKKNPPSFRFSHPTDNTANLISPETKASLLAAIASEVKDREMKSEQVGLAFFFLLLLFFA